jgi:hypothetical protein
MHNYIYLLYVVLISVLPPTILIIWRAFAASQLFSVALPFSFPSTPRRKKGNLLHHEQDPINTGPK